MLNLSDCKSILCLSGDLPSAEFFHNNMPIIAADGATNNLMRIGITPQLIIGDLDSVKPEYLEKIPSHYHYDQNYCDFEKALSHLAKEELLPAVVVGINGGSLDHVLNNVNHFMNTDCVLYAPPITGFIMRNAAVKQWNLPLNSKISLLGIPNASVSTQGFKWDLSSAILNFPGANSCFNRSVSSEIKITLHEGALLVLIYDEAASLNP